MHIAGALPDADAYTALVGALQDAGQSASASQVFDAVHDAGGVSKEPTLQWAHRVHAAALDGNWQRALSIFDRMCETTDLAPTVQMYTTLISAMEKTGEWKEAMGVFNRMCADGVPPNTVTYTLLLSAMAKGGHWRQLLRVYAGMTSAGLAPTHVTYNILVSATMDAGQWQQALGFFKEMVAAGLSPDSTTTIGTGACQIDLHGCSSGVAVAVVVTLLSSLQATRNTRKQQGLCIVTGRGRRSEVQFKPVIRPQVTNLLDTLEPPLRWHFDNANDGRVLVSADELDSWLASCSPDWTVQLSRKVNVMKKVRDAKRKKAEHTQMVRAHKGCVVFD